MDNRFIDSYLEENAPTQNSIAEKLNISISDVKKLQLEHRECLLKLQAIRNKYRSKKNIVRNKKKVKNPNFRFLSFKEFYVWFVEQEKKQKSKCFYCAIEDYKLKYLFDNKILSTKRKRGRALEIERVNSHTNEYSSKNCVLACYFCNNHKSDIVSEDDHKKYFTKNIYKYLNDKFQSTQQMLGGK